MWFFLSLLSLFQCFSIASANADSDVAVLAINLAIIEESCYFSRNSESAPTGLHTCDIITPTTGGAMFRPACIFSQHSSGTLKGKYPPFTLIYSCLLAPPAARAA